MTILVTGGCGFIGSNFVRYMLEAHPEYTIVNLDKLTYAGNLENLDDVEDHPHYHFIKGDICDRVTVGAVIKDYHSEVIINFAAESHVDRSIMGPAVFIETNVAGTNVLLEVAKENNIRRFIQISTDEVYGSLGPTGKFTESTPLHPNSPYAASKAAGDLLALAYHRTFGLPVIITRCSNNYGPYQFPEKLIPLMIANAIDGKPLPVYGDGLNVRDWLFVKDHCTAVDLVLHKGIVGEVYNIGGNNEWKNISVVKLLLKKLGKPENLIALVKDRPGHDRRYAMDASKIMNELHWRPSVTFEEGLSETVNWYLSHESWWRHIISGEYQQYYRKMYEER
ncbi:MAG: dTDP-glucose 4,6-dehydratase [Ignavibacteriae bacterium]|nr:dTDP-glucose 4,6-dehydratase [Ignavibacteriota bacterium]